LFHIDDLVFSKREIVTKKNCRKPTFVLLTKRQNGNEKEGQLNIRVMQHKCWWGNIKARYPLQDTSVLVKTTIKKVLKKLI